MDVCVHDNGATRQQGKVEEKTNLQQKTTTEQIAQLAASLRKFRDGRKWQTRSIEYTSKCS